jgi:hypothetical protein
MADPAAIPSLPGFETSFTPPPPTRPGGRRWLIVLLVVVMVAGASVAALSIGHGGSKPVAASRSSTTTTAPPTTTTQPSTATVAGQFQTAEKALSVQGVPYAQTFTSDVSNAANTLTTDEAQISQMTTSSEEAITAAASPTSPQSEAEMQCDNSTLSAATPDEPVSQMMAAFQKCPVPDDGSAALGQEFQLGKSMVTTVTSDLQNADGAMRSLAGVLAQETTLASQLAVPSSLASDKQELLSALEAATVDADTAATASTVSGASQSAQQLADAIEAATAQTNSLVTAMKG